MRTLGFLRLFETRKPLDIACDEEEDVQQDDEDEVGGCGLSERSM